MDIRAATESDLPEIQAIYAHHVLTGTGTFEEAPPSLEDMTARYNAITSPGWAWCVAFDATGALYVADMHNCRVRKIGTDAQHTVSTYAGSIIGWQDGPAAQAQFNNLSGLAFASDGTLYVLDTFNRAIRRIGTDAQHTVVTLVGGDQTLIGEVDGPGNAARMGPQGGLALFGGKLYVSDVAFDRIRLVTPGADMPSTTVQTFAGSGRVALEDGTGDLAALAAPMAIAGGPDGALYLADSGNGAIRRLQP